MSLKLVKRLLQVTANDFHTTEGTTTKSSNTKKRSGAHKKNKSMDETPIEADQEQVLTNHYVSKLVGLDRAMMGQTKAKHSSTSSSNREKKDKTKRPTTKTKGSSQTAKHNMILGNTRSSASALQNQPLQPTFQKRLYRKQQKETKLKEIGKLLKQTKKKMEKHNDSKTKGKSSRLRK